MQTYDLNYSEVSLVGLKTTVSNAYALGMLFTSASGLIVKTALCESAAKAGQVSCLSRCLDTLKHPQAHDGPGSQQTAGAIHVELPSLFNGICDVKGLPVPEICSG